MNSKDTTFNLFLPSRVYFFGSNNSKENVHFFKAFTSKNTTFAAVE